MTNKITIKTRIVLWFSISLLVLVSLMFLLMAVISNSVLYSDAKLSLIELAKSNATEIEFYNPSDGKVFNPQDQYIEYNGGYLEIDDNFCTVLNGVYTTLYSSDGTLLYGEIPDVQIPATSFQKNSVQIITGKSDDFFLYDIALEGNGLDGLWLRSAVSKSSGKSIIDTLVTISLALFPIIAIIAVVGGYFVAKRSLRPIDNITSAADEIREGKDLSKRLPVYGGYEMRHLSNTFNSMFDRLEKSFESERQFTSDASHEMRTPVSVILAQCEYALDSTDENAKTEALEAIQRQSLRLSKLISRLLSFTRLEQGTKKVSLELTDLSTLTREICSEQQILAEASGAELTFSEGESVYAYADKELYKVLLQNLTGNAVKYSGENGKIHVSLRRENNRIILSVADNGIGISDSDKEKIFNRFYRADSSRSTEGLGLGLAMVKQIALLHGGEISAESTLGVGSTFTFSMPESKK